MRARLLTLAAAAALILVAPAAARAASDLVLTDIAPSGSFSHPVYVTSPPGDASRVFVVEQAGTIRLLHGGAAPTLFLTVPDVLYVGGEQGLLSIAFAPDYATSGRLYVYYTDKNSCENTPAACDIRIDEYRSSGGDAATADPATRRLVLRIPHRSYANHDGGQLQFGPDGYLYAGPGDGGGHGDPDGRGQSLSVMLGKLLRIDPRGTTDGDHAIPPGNPFVGQAGVPPEIFSYGLRNPWRFSFDAFTGDLALADVGENDREEVDLVPAGQGAGANFGWKTCEGEIAYPGGGPCSLSGPGDVAPVLTYSHDKWHNDGDYCNGSIIGGVVVRDRRLPTLAGRYLFGDYCHQYVWTADLRAGTMIDTQLSVGPGVTSISQDAACRTYVTSKADWVRRVDPAPNIATGPEGCPPRPPPASVFPGGSASDRSDAAVPVSAAGADRSPPVITSLAMARDRFVVAGGPTAINATGRGTAFRFTLSERGVVTIRIERARLGRRVGRRCLTATRARRGRPGCTRLTAAGALTRRLPAGRRSVPFSGRLGRRALVAGHHRATITERDSSGNLSRGHILRFEVLAR